MRTVHFLLGLTVCCIQAKAQLSGTLTIPSDYPSLSALISDLNQHGVSGPLTVQLPAQYTETVPPGGLMLTATGSAAAPIVFRKSGQGANPLLIAYGGGKGTPGAMNQDGIWRLIGSDYVTIDGIDLLDPNTANPETMEFGFGFFKADAHNGCHNNLIQNCVITLNRVNNAAGTGPAGDGSRGIDVVNALAGVHNLAVTVLSASGSHSYNRFYANTIRNCNIGISLSGFVDTSPFGYADKGNELGGLLMSEGNRILDYGGGGTASSAAAIRALAQQDLRVVHNFINNNTGTGLNHPALLRGIYLSNAGGTHLSVLHNTLTLHGGATASRLSVIENASGSSPAPDTVSIRHNLILGCTYVSAVSGPFYGIWNNAAPEFLQISDNTFTGNSTGALSGSTYLIYNNGAVRSGIQMNNNRLSFTYQGSAPYTGGMFSICNTGGGGALSLEISDNIFSDYRYIGHAGTGGLYFIHNTGHTRISSVRRNRWSDLSMYHQGTQYLISHQASTQTLLDLRDNTAEEISRTAAAGATYLCYSAGASPGTCVQYISGNHFSGIHAMVPGTGQFYGICSMDGTGSTYPRKVIGRNSLQDIRINSTGVFYGYYASHLGDSASLASAVHQNTLHSVSRQGPLYGLYITGTVSAAAAPDISENLIRDLSSSGPAAGLYGIFLAGGGAGIDCQRNRVAGLWQNGASGTASGLYVSGAVNTTLSNNVIGEVSAPNSSAANAVNGIYIQSGTSARLIYNTVYLSALSTGGNFNSNALYCFSNTALLLKNNILVNRSSGGTGIACAYRRSSTSLNGHMQGSDHNFLYAGVPGPSRVILQAGVSSYTSLAAFQAALSPRESSSVSEDPVFLNTSSASPNFLRLSPHILSSAESGASPDPGVTRDLDHRPRYGNPAYTGTGTAPDIGAYEYEQNLSPCSTALAGTLSLLKEARCEGQALSLYSEGYTSGTGVLHQWRVSAVPGGPYIPVSGGTGAMTPEYTSASLPAGSYYFVLETTCTHVPVSALSPEFELVVLPLPPAVAALSSTLVCEGDTVFLSGQAPPGMGYKWQGPKGFVSVQQHPVLLNTKAVAAGVYTFSAISNGCASPGSSVALSVSEISLSLSAGVNSICLGGSATLSLSTSGSSYTWSTGETTSTIQVSPGMDSIYRVLARNEDNCQVQDSLKITVITPSIAAINATGCGGSAVLTLSVQAFSASQVQWYASPVSTQVLASGQAFNLVVSADTLLYAEAQAPMSGCQSPRIPVSAILAPYPVLSAQAQPSAVCPGQPATLTAMGAQSYFWTGLGAGHSRVVTPGETRSYLYSGLSVLGCQAWDSVRVEVYPLPLIQTAQSATMVCPSSVVHFTASGAEAFFWDTGANGALNTVTPAVNSTYTVYGTNSYGCLSTRTLAVFTRSVPVVEVISSRDQICPGEVVTFTASGAVSYTWLPGAHVGSTFSASPVVPSVYNAIGRSINTCTSVGMAGVDVEACVGTLSDAGAENGIRVYPNPSPGVLKLDWQAPGSCGISVFSPAGGCVFQAVLSRDRRELDLSWLPKGLYFLELNAGGGVLKQRLVLY